MNIQLIGKISGLDLEVAKRNFEQVEEVLTGLGHKVWNPLKEVDPTWPYKHQMRLCINNLCDPETEAICPLPNWTDSEGARAEYLVAHSLGLDIVNVLGIKAIV